MACERSIVPLMSQLRIKEAELDALLVLDEPDEQAVIGKMDEMSSLHGAIRKERIDTDLDIREVLPPEQRMQYDGRHLQGPQGPPDPHQSRMPGTAGYFPGLGHGQHARDHERWGGKE